MSLGPIMLDLAGTELLPEEREILLHPLVGGVILFSRNCATRAQLRRLTETVHALREPRLLIAVDHEGGRVQRFREGFTRLPAAALFGKLYGRAAARARSLCETCGTVLGTELAVVGVDFSFAPVLDVNKGASKVIGDRAFHRDPEVVAELGRALMRGMARAGMAAVGKHFPGHGTVEADSHVETPLDPRSLESIRLDDLLAFERMIHYGLPAIMPAHVTYSAVDDRPAGFSPVWLRGVLREQLGFQGAVFSDDISMGGAEVAGDFAQRARAALDAGCDMVLACNDQTAAERLLDDLSGYENPVAATRLARMHAHPVVDQPSLGSNDAYRQAARLIGLLEKEPELDLQDDRPA